jgi:hypothetical protein
LKANETKTVKPLTLVWFCADIEAMHCSNKNNLKYQLPLKIRKINQKDSIFAIDYGYQNKTQ